MYIVTLLQLGVKVLTFSPDTKQKGRHKIKTRNNHILHNVNNIYNHQSEPGKNSRQV